MDVSTTAEIAARSGPRAPRRHRVTLAAGVLVVLLIIAVLFIGRGANQQEEVSGAEFTSNTPGVPAGTRLTVHEGDIIVKEPGAYVDGLDVHGLIFIRAPDVTIMNTIVRGRPVEKNSALVSNFTTGYPFTVRDSELIATHPSPYINGVIGSNFTLRNVVISSVVDGVHITGDDVVVESSWIRDHLHFAVDPNHNGGPSHDDSIQIQAGANIRIADNVMTGPRAAVMQITQDRGPVSNVRFLRNEVDNGFCSVNVDENDYGPIRGLVVANNVFGRNTSHFNCAIIAPPSTTVVSRGNFFTDGAPVTITRGR
ncbi:right-handed parallel beta-helix repeat-containing protein [Planctomonas psychrotolerans]|uniref:hypothetical protein n=1 Tax=Planctomonas psychrotolerans TaxID=2528712 RepID=UPI00123B5B6A|nr:hypothetical protein [Planctomonas psychrotolerans]